MASSDILGSREASLSDDDAPSEKGVLLAILQLARDIDELTDRADALGLGLPGLKLSEAAELCRKEGIEPGTR